MDEPFTLAELFDASCEGFNPDILAELDSTERAAIAERLYQEAA